MENDPIILEDMQRLGLDPAQWRYDAKLHRYVEAKEVERPAGPAIKPLLATEDWDPQTGAKLPTTGALVKQALGETWDTVNKPLAEIAPRMTKEDISNPVLRGAVNFGGNTVNSMTSGLSVATLPFAAARVVSTLPSLARSAGVGFGVMGGYSALEAGTRIKGELLGDQPLDAERLTEAAGQLALSPIMMYGGRELARAGTRALPPKATPPAAAATVQNVPPVEHPAINSIEAGADLSVQESALLNSAAKNSPLAEKPQSVRAPDTAQVSEIVKARKLQDKVYDEAFARLLKDRGLDPATFTEQVALNPELASVARELNATLKSAGIERAAVVEGLTEPDLVLGDPTGSVKSAAVETAPIVGKNLPDPASLIPEGFAPVDTRQFVARSQAAELAGRPRTTRPLIGAVAEQVPVEAPTPIIPVEQPRNVIAQPRAVDPLQPTRLSNAQRRALEVEQLSAPQHPTVEGQRVGQYPAVPMKETRALSKLQRQRILKGKGLQVQPKPDAAGGFVDFRGAIDTLKRATAAVGEVTKHGVEVGKQMIPGIKQLPFRGAELLGDTLDALYTKRRELGRYANEFRAVINDANMAAAERAQVAAIADKRAKNFDASNRLDPDAAKILQSWRNTLKQMRAEQIASGQPVWDPVTGNVRQAGMDPFYFPEVPARQVLSELKRKHDKSQYYTDYVDKRMREGATRDAAAAELNAYLGGFDIYGNHSGGFSSTFGAVRKVESKGLPDSWIDPNPDRGLNRYANSFARDRALYDVIEKNHDAMTMLGQKQDFYGNAIKSKTPDLANLSSEPLVTRALEEYFGVGSDISNPVIRGLEQVTSATIIGVPSKLWDLGGVVKMATFLPEGLAQAPGMLKHLASLDRLKIAGQHAIEQGLAKPGLTAVDSAHNIIKNISKHHETWGEALSETANIIQRISGTQHLELYAKTLAQGAGEYIGNLHAELARAGSPESITFMKELFGDRWQSITPEQMGARIAELNQGAYDARALPHIPQSIRPFFKLARWSIEQAYHTKQFMIDPAFRGNFKPAIAGTVSGLTAASLVNTIITELTGVQNSIPTEKEIEHAKAAEQGKLRAYKLIALANTVGIGGIVGSVTKGMLDKFVMKMDARGFTYPLYEVANNAQKQTVAAAEAIAQGEDVLDVVPAYLSKMVFGNSQTLRFAQQVALQMGAENAMGQTQLDANRRTDYRNRRMYEITQGLPVPPIQPPQADYSRVSVQKFKRTDDPAQAAKLLPGVLNRAVRRANGDPSTLKRELHNLRVLPIHSMPDPERDPQGFQVYYQWLEKTKGPAEARATVARYAKLKNANQMKQSAIPKID